MAITDNQIKVLAIELESLEQSLEMSELNMLKAKTTVELTEEGEEINTQSKEIILNLEKNIDSLKALIKVNSKLLEGVDKKDIESLLKETE